jgi:site-specific recombinase XerD
MTNAPFHAQAECAAPARIAPDPAELDRLTSQARTYILSAKSNATLRAYRADWRHFDEWCRAKGFAALPASPDTVGLYLGEIAATHRPATLSRRLTSINKVHRVAGLPAPALMEHLSVGEVLKGIRRTRGTAQIGKQPLFTNELRTIVDSLPRGLIGIRDRALLLIGFAGAFRRSELAAIRVEDVEETKEGLLVRILRSKTDPEGKGREAAIPYGSTPETCPVRAWRDWMTAAKIASGPLFRHIDRHNHINPRGLHRDSIGGIVKRAVSAAGLDPKIYAGHSLRAGFCTQAYLNGAREFDIMRQTGHHSLDTLRKYIRGRGLFRDNAAAKLGL